MKEKVFELVCEALLEKFGRKIGNSPSTVGVPDERDELEEVAPPGREKQVLAIKRANKKKPKSQRVNPWAIAWAAEKNEHKKNG